MQQSVWSSLISATVQRVQQCLCKYCHLSIYKSSLGHTHPCGYTNTFIVHFLCPIAEAIIDWQLLFVLLRISPVNFNTIVPRAMYRCEYFMQIFHANERLGSKEGISSGLVWVGCCVNWAWQGSIVSDILVTQALVVGEFLRCSWATWLILGVHTSLSEIEMSRKADYLSHMQSNMSGLQAQGIAMVFSWGFWSYSMWNLNVSIFSILNTLQYVTCGALYSCLHKCRALYNAVIKCLAYSSFHVSSPEKGTRDIPLINALNRGLATSLIIAVNYLCISQKLWSRIRFKKHCMI